MNEQKEPEINEFTKNGLVEMLKKLSKNPEEIEDGYIKLLDTEPKYNKYYKWLDKNVHNTNHAYLQIEDGNGNTYIIFDYKYYRQRSEEGYWTHLHTVRDVTRTEQKLLNEISSNAFQRKNFRQFYKELYLLMFYYNISALKYLVEILVTRNVNIRTLI